MGYKIFTNGSPLPASDLNDFLMKQSVMVFADAAARDAALTAPTEGMLVYLENNNHLSLYTGSAWHTQNPINAQGDLIIGNSSGQPSRLGIGTNGQLLQSNGTTATWTTYTPPAPAPTYADWEVLASGSITTGSSSMSISGWSARDNLVLFVNSISGSLTTAQGVEIRINGDASNHQATYANIRGLSTYSAGIVNDATLGAFRIGQLSTNASSVVTGGILIRGARKSNGSIAMCDIFGAGGAGGGNSNEAWIGKGYYDGAAAVSSLLIRLSGVGNNIDSGTYVLLGSD